MILTGSEIVKQINKGGISIAPFNQSNINPNSYDVTLHDTLYVYENSILDPKLNMNLIPIQIPEEGITLHPGILYLGRTNEYTECWDYVPMLEGKSSIGRLGIDVHKTAGVGDIGFRGVWTLEIAVTQPVILYRGIRIAQLIFYTIEGEIGTVYEGKYQGDKGVSGSRMYKEFSL